MRYMLLIYSPEAAWSPEEWTECTRKSWAICQELDEQGKFQAASPLHPVSTATTVRVRGAQRQITTGPFAETIEQLGGFFIVDLGDLDEAITLASRLPAVHKGTVEIRPMRGVENLPNAKFQAAVPAGMRRYILLCYHDEANWNATEPKMQRKHMEQTIALAQRLDQEGRFISTSALHDSTTSTSVRIREGRRLITDGPFAETREVLGGYYLMLANDQPEAEEYAIKQPCVLTGSVEVREVYDLE
jgi:hypothetical protein